MNKISLPEDLGTLFKYVIVGAIGFGIGGLLGYILHHFGCVLGGIPYYFCIASVGAILGAVGAISLGIISKNIKKMCQLVLFGAIGFMIGNFLSNIFLIFSKLPLLFMGWFLDGYGLLEGPNLVSELLFVIVPVFIAFTLGGAIGSAIYGTALNYRRLPLAVSGGFGFGFGSVLAFLFVGRMDHMMYHVILGMSTGAFLGLGMYWCEKHET